MPAPANTLLIEGSFEELSDELALYLDNLVKSQPDTPSNIQSEIEPLLKEDKKDEVLKKLVTGSAALNSAPEKELVAAYNLLIYLIRQSSQPRLFLPRLCQNLARPITSSPTNGTGIALSILSTIFNILQPDDNSRYHVLFAVLQVIRNSASFEVVRTQLRHLDSWLEQWDMEEEEKRRLYLAIVDTAQDASEADDAYEYLLRALRTFDVDDAAKPEARELSLRALKTALMAPAHFDFQDLTSLDSVQALRKSDSTYIELLEVFASGQLEDYNDFKDEHEGWVEAEKLDGAALNRKMRLLTLASLAASAKDRSLPYHQIAHDLQIPEEEVELWVIDVIRAGLVEGKLSQQTKTFLIHRSTYRVFGEKQWREVAQRLEVWKTSLVGVLAVVRQEKENFIVQKEQELKEMEHKANGAEGGGQRGFRGHHRQQQQQQQAQQPQTQQPAVEAD